MEPSIQKAAMNTDKSGSKSGLHLALLILVSAQLMPTVEFGGHIL